MTDGPSGGEAPRPGQLFRFAAGLYLAVAVGGIVWIGSRDGAIPLSRFVAADRWWLDLALGLAAGLAIAGAFAGLRGVSALARDLEATLAEALGPLERDEIFGLALLSGVAEEVFFRGAMQPAWGFWPTVVVFAVCHTGRGRALWVWTAMAFGAGIGLGWLAEATGSLLAPIATHVTVNLIGLSRLSTASSDPG